MSDRNSTANMLGASDVDLTMLSPVLSAMREAKRDAAKIPRCPECKEPLEWGDWMWGDPASPVWAWWCRTRRCPHISPITVPQ